MSAGQNDEAEDKDKIGVIEDYPEHPHETGAAMDVFFTRHDVIAMVADEMRKATAAMVTEATLNTVEDNFADAIHFGYSPVKQGSTVSILHIIEVVFSDEVQ